MDHSNGSKNPYNHDSQTIPTRDQAKSHLHMPPVLKGKSNPKTMMKSKSSSLNVNVGKTTSGGHT